MQVEMLPDIANAPRILPNYTQNIPANLKKVQIVKSALIYIHNVICILCNFMILQDLDNYIRTRGPVSFLSELRGHLQVSV